jgi:hypothetical protein
LKQLVSLNPVSINYCDRRQFPGFGISVHWLGHERFVAEGNVVTRHPQFGSDIEFVGLSQDSRRLHRFLENAACEDEHTTVSNGWRRK